MSYNHTSQNIPNDRSAIDERRRYTMLPKRIVLAEGQTGKVNSPDALLSFNFKTCKMEASNSSPYIILDFGEELNGGISIDVISTSPLKFSKIRIRFGESVSEVMNTPSNDHAIHDLTLNVPFFGKQEFGNTGFRFVRIDLIDSHSSIEIRQINALALERPLKYIGKFNCSDELLNSIWSVGARTQHLCCQDYILDGIKRDRLVWAGDIHPQIHVIGSVFGNIDIVPKTINYLRDAHPAGMCMNEISSYTLWWIITLWDWFVYTGDIDFLSKQEAYLTETTNWIIKDFITDEGYENLPDTRFLDWATAGKDTDISCGLQALLAWAIQNSINIFKSLGIDGMVATCQNTLQKLMNAKQPYTDNKHVNALKVLTQMADPGLINESVFTKEPCKNISPWFGYYVLNARAMAGDIQGCLDLIREYWGGMLQLGATTFWEHFDVEWLHNAARIDEIVPIGKIDVHLSKGKNCYKGLRHSLCHAWASCPTAWLSQNILGIRALEPGFKKITIVPKLTGLNYANGIVPTPFGTINVKHEKTSEGKTRTSYDAPKEIEVVVEEPSLLVNA